LANKLFKNPSGLIFECCGIARTVPIIIDKTEVHLDFHVFAILEFDLLIGDPFENIVQKEPRSLNEEFGKTASATHSDTPMAKQHPNHDLFEDVKFISLFVSPKLAYGTKRASSPSLEPCPSGYPSTILEKENFCAMDISEPTLETKRRNSTYEHENFTFKTPQVSCSLEVPRVDLF
jgi:hypothetical protein